MKGQIFSWKKGRGKNYMENLVRTTISRQSLKHQEEDGRITLK
jgi:hypothetical protein